MFWYTGTVKRTGFSKVRVTNYQSIRQADVPLGPLTVIVGDNDAGKSALLRAIRAACFNDTGVSFITHGEPKTEVELTLHNGASELPTTLLWRKKREGGATYDLTDEVGGNGTTKHFSKLGSAVPPEVAAALNIADIEVDKTFSISPQVHRQGEYAFLVDRSEGQAARALAKMTKLDVVVEAQGLIRTDLKRINADLKATTALVADLETQMKEFEGLDAEVKLLENVSDFLGLAESEQRRISLMATTFTQYVNARHATEDLDTLPPSEAVDKLKTDYNWLRAARLAYEALDTAKKTMPNTVWADCHIPDFAAKLAKAQKMRVAFDAARHADYALVNIAEEAEQVEKVHNLLIEEWNEQGTCDACGQLLPMALIR